MSDARELYQEMILDHGRKPRNFRFPDPANRRAEGHNPLCGDKLELRLRLNGDTIEDIGFQGAGCAISTAAASTMTEAVKGKTRGEVERLSEAFRALVTGKAEGAELPPKLGVFAGVAEFPMRVKCATLAWHTLEAALHQQSEPVTTEDGA